MATTLRGKKLEHRVAILSKFFSVQKQNYETYKERVKCDDEWIHRMWYIHNHLMEYYSAIKRT